MDIIELVLRGAAGVPAPNTPTCRLEYISEPDKEVIRVLFPYAEETVDLELGTLSQWWCPCAICRAKLKSGDEAWIPTKDFPTWQATICTTCAILVMPEEKRDTCTDV